MNACRILGFAALFTVFPPRVEAEPVPRRTILLVDDHDVLYRSGTQRVLHPAQRHPRNPLVSQDKPWEVAIGWTSVYRDPPSGRYQLWYQAYAGKRAGDKRLECVVCYAESPDGIEFVKPELNLHPFKDHAATNIVLVGNGGYGDRYCNSVLVEPQAKDPCRRYKMAYYDWSVVDGREYPGLHVAFSPDGVRWTKHGRGPLNRTAYGARGLPPPLDGEDPYRETQYKGRLRKTWTFPLSMSDAADVFWDPAREAYAICGKMWIDAPDGTTGWKHGMGRIESKDFLHWSKPEFLLAPDDLDPPDAEFHTSPVFHHGGRYFSLNQILDRKARGAIDIELMISRDGRAWQRPFRRPYFLARSEPGQFDSRSIFSNSTPVVLDDEIRFYYGAYNQSPIGGVRAESGHRSGVGLATIPRDRFAGVRSVELSAQATLKRPLEHVGQVTLKPLDVAGCRGMTLNADAREGSVRAELLTEDGYRVGGFCAEQSAEITGDSLRHPIRWNGRRMDQLPPGRHMLRLHLRRAEVYAVTLLE